MTYLFIGQDALSKETQLKKIKEEFLAKELQQFNLDTLYAKELTPKGLQERLLYIPLKSQKRIVAIKEAQDLTEDCKEFLLQYIKRPDKQIILILDMDRQESKDGFINRIYKHAKVYRFRETKRLDTFALGRLIDANNLNYALRALNQLLKDGEKPERILGGLRYAWERNITNRFQIKKRLNLLLNCDMDIKTGKLRPVFALEKLIISLCGLGKPFH